ncbi:MAG: HPr family phosphocarrier protein [Desulfovibrionales bacterium]|nr:HPr family phosphocarrier protein [Desulfovibrionales bacterium]
MEPTGENNSLTVSVCVENELGLHARPAGKLAQLAQSFKADIALCVADERADAKSILDILSLAASHGTTLRIEATGPDAGEAVQKISKLFEDKFEGD